MARVSSSSTSTTRSTSRLKPKAEAQRYWNLALKNSKRRDFRITFGRIEGYGNKGKPKIASRGMVRSAIGQWLKSRQEEGLPYQSGMLDFAEMIYIRRPEFGGKILFEPIVTYSGIISPTMNAGLSDREAWKMLQSCADFVGARLRQERVYVEYIGRVGIRETTGGA